MLELLCECCVLLIVLLIFPGFILRTLVHNGSMHIITLSLYKFVESQ